MFFLQGAVLNDKPESDDPATFDWYGSSMVIVAESKEEVKAIIEKDIYTVSGVWDTEKVSQLSQISVDDNMPLTASARH